MIKVSHSSIMRDAENSGVARVFVFVAG